MALAATQQPSPAKWQQNTAGSLAGESQHPAAIIESGGSVAAFSSSRAQRILLWQPLSALAWRLQWRSGGSWLSSRQRP